MRNFSYKMQVNPLISKRKPKVQCYLISGRPLKQAKKEGQMLVNCLATD